MLCLSSYTAPICMRLIGASSVIEAQVSYVHCMRRDSHVWRNEQLVGHLIASPIERASTLDNASTFIKLMLQVLFN